jgi:hypothetical protein
MHIPTDPEDMDFVGSMELQKRPVTEDQSLKFEGYVFQRTDR